MIEALHLVTRGVSEVEPGTQTTKQMKKQRQLTPGTTVVPSGNVIINQYRAQEQTVLIHPY